LDQINHSPDERGTEVEQMTLEGSTVISKQKKYYHLHVPVSVGSDSSFPFDVGDTIHFTISGKCVILSKTLS